MESLSIKPAFTMNQRNSEHDVLSKYCRDTATNVKATVRPHTEERSKSGRAARTTRIPVSKNNRSPISNALLNYSGDSGIGTTKQNEPSFRSLPKYDVRRTPAKLAEFMKEKPRQSHIPRRKFRITAINDVKGEAHNDVAFHVLEDEIVEKLQILKYIPSHQIHPNLDSESPDSSLRSYPKSQVTEFTADTDGTSGKNRDIIEDPEPLGFLSPVVNSEKATAVYDSVVIATNKIKAVNESVSKWLNDEFKICAFKEPKTSSNCRYCSLTEDSKETESPVFHLDEKVGICLANNEREMTKETRFNEVHYDFPKRNFKDIPIVKQKSKSNTAVIKPSTTDDTMKVTPNYTTNTAYVTLEVNNVAIGVNKDFQYPSSGTIHEPTVPSYTVCPSEVLQKTTNFECCDSLTNSSPVTDLDRDNFSSQFTIEHPDEYAIMDAWCPHTEVSQNNISFMKCTKCSKDKSGPWAKRENNEGFSDGTTKDFSDGTNKDSAQSNNAQSFGYHSGDVTCIYNPKPRSEKRQLKKIDKSKKQSIDGQFKLFGRNHSRQHQRRWIHVWKNKTKWSNWSRAPFKFRKCCDMTLCGLLRMVHSMERSIIWDDADAQTNVLVFRETGTDMALQPLRSTAIATSASFGFLKKTLDKERMMSTLRLRSPFKHINMGPSRFPFSHNTCGRMKSASLPKPIIHRDSKREAIIIGSDMYKKFGFFETHPGLNYRCNIQENKVAKVNRALSPVLFEKYITDSAIATDSIHTTSTFISKEMATSAVSIRSNHHEQQKVFHDSSTEPCIIENNAFAKPQPLVMSVGFSTDFETNLLYVEEGQSCENIASYETDTQMSQEPLIIKQSVGIHKKMSTNDDDTQVLEEPLVTKQSVGIHKKMSTNDGDTQVLEPLVTKQSVGIHKKMSTNDGDTQVFVALVKKQSVGTYKNICINDGDTQMSHESLVTKQSVGIHKKVSINDDDTQMSHSHEPLFTKQSVGIHKKVSINDDETQSIPAPSIETCTLGTSPDIQVQRIDLQKSCSKLNSYNEMQLVAPSLQKLSLGMSPEFQERCSNLEKFSSITADESTKGIKIFPTASAESISIEISRESQKCVVENEQKEPISDPDSTLARIPSSMYLTMSHVETQVHPETVTVKTMATGAPQDDQTSDDDYVPLTRAPKKTAILSTSQSSLVESLYQPFVFEVGTMSSIHEQKSIGILTAKDDAHTSNKSVMNLDLQPKIVSTTTSTRMLTSTTSTGHSATNLKDFTLDVYVQYSTHKCLAGINSKEIQTDREIKSAAVLTSSIALDKATDPDNGSTIGACNYCGKQFSENNCSSNFVARFPYTTQTSCHREVAAVQCTSKSILPPKEETKSDLLSCSEQGQLQTLVRLIGKPKSNPNPEGYLGVSAISSSGASNKWMRWCHPCCNDTIDNDSYIDSEEEGYQTFKLISRITTKNIKPICGKSGLNAIKHDAPMPFENLSKDSLTEEITIKKKRKKSELPEVSVYHTEQPEVIKKPDINNKITSELKPVKELKESILQTGPEIKDTGTSPVCNRRSAGVITSQCLLQNQHVCYHYPEIDISPMDCILIYDPPKCTVHARTLDTTPPKGCMQDTGHKKKRRENLSAHSIGLLTSCLGMPQTQTQTIEKDMIGDILPPKAYKSLYKSAQMIEKEFNNGTDGFILAGDDVIMRDNRSQSTVTSGHGAGKCHRIASEVARSCSSNYHARVLYMPPFYDQDTSDDHVKKNSFGSCRYYSHLLSRQLVRVKENIKHLRTTDECVYRLSTIRCKTACTMIPSGRIELCCQTTKRQNSTTPLSRSVMAPSVTNTSDGRNKKQGLVAPSRTSIGDAQDKKHLKNIYYMLTAIEGRIRRLRHNIQT